MRSLLGYFLSLCALFLGAPVVFAAPPSYEAMVLSVSSPAQMAPGQTQTVYVSFKNIGSKPWLPTGRNYVSLYHWNPTSKIETSSALAHSSWNTDKRPLLVPVSRLNPGQEILFQFVIKAPMNPGRYHGDFILAAENIAWMKGSRFGLDVEVTNAQVTSNTSQVTGPQVTPPAAGYLLPATPQASDWQAELVEIPGREWQIDSGEHVTVRLGFKNTGIKTWKRDEQNYVSLYAVDGNNKERKSVFKDYQWLSDSHPVKMQESEVKPGQIGHFMLEIRAPLTPGAYQELFALAAENTAWIKGGTVTLPIKVPWSSEFIATAPPGNEMITSVSEEQAKPRNGDYVATLLLRSAMQLTLLGNGRQELTFGFKNAGKSVWGSRGLRVVSVAPALADNLSSIRDDSWMETSRPTRVLGATNPGEIGFLTFKIKAPTKKGNYVATLALEADGQTVEGGQFDIPITVTADGYIEPRLPTTPSASLAPALTNLAPLGGDVSSLPTEPNIRVGLFRTTDNQMVVRAKFAPLTVYQKDGATVCRLGMGELVTIRFDRTNRAYIASGGNCVATSAEVFRVRADDGISPMEISDFSRGTDNTFRSQLELRYTPATDNVWVINELPIEWYLKGIAETSNSSPSEFQRTLLTTARTYAMYHVQRGTKHANENYTVDATYDQVYRGYGAESRNPNVAAAVDATRGQIVTYDGKLAITPYFSRSDGRTRAWTEVWGGGPYPWMVSVPVPWDQGKTLWGHGVGMSATGALGMANDGKRYDEILKYFFQGTELRIAYK